MHRRYEGFHVACCLYVRAVEVIRRSAGGEDFGERVEAEEGCFDG